MVSKGLKAKFMSKIMLNDTYLSLYLRHTLKLTFL